MIRRQQSTVPDNRSSISDPKPGEYLSSPLNVDIVEYVYRCTQIAKANWMKEQAIMMDVKELGTFTLILSVAVNTSLTQWHKRTLSLVLVEMLVVALGRRSEEKLA